MAEAWGAWQCQYNYKDWRGGVNAWVVSETATTATIRVEARYNSPFARHVNTTYAYTNCDGNNSGWVSTGGLNQPSNVDTTYVRRTQDYVIAKGSSGRNVWCAAGVQIGGSYSPGTSDAGVNVWVNAITYSAPNAPTGASVTKNSDWQATVKWTNNPSSPTKPYNNVYVERRTDSGSWTQIASLSGSTSSYVDKGITTSHSYAYRVRAHNTAGYSGYATTGTITTSYTPNAPTSCSASRVSDSQAKVTWKNNPATNRPYVNVLLERQTDNGSWTQIASLGSSTANYTNNGISANHRYAYRVRAHNNAGNSGYATSGYIYTTPKAPSSVTVTKVSNTQVSVNITGAAPYATSYNVQYQLNGGPWTSAGSTSSWPFKHTPGGGTVKYRVQAVRSSLASGWVESGTIQTVMPPNAPTVSLSPSASVVPVGTALTVSWKPNHPDGSAQSAAQVEVTRQDGTVGTVDVFGATTSYTRAAEQQATTGTVKFRVRTKGLDPDWGAWSGYATVSVAVVPTGYFTYPATDGAAIGGIPVDLEWSVTDPAGVASQTLSILGSDGTDLYSVQLGGSVRELSIGPDRYSFANLTAYRIRLTVLSGSGLSTVITRSFQTSWAGPADPYPLVTYGDGLSASVTVGDSESAPGDVIEIDRPAGSLLPGLTVYGATRQNLWLNPNGKRNGVTVTANANDSVTVSGTSTAAAYISIASYILRPGTTYVLSVDKDVPFQGFYVAERDAESELATVSHFVKYADSPTTFTVSSNTGNCTFGVGVQHAEETVSGTYRVMLNEGSEPEPWCPPGLNSVGDGGSVEVVTAGRNLASTSESSAPNFQLVDYFLPAGEYTLSIGDMPGGFAFNIRAPRGLGVGTSDDSVLVNVSSSVSTFTLDYASPLYINGYSTLATPLQDIQLELGSTATAYEPPAVTTTPIDLDGHSLNSLPDGTRDELTINEAGELSLTQRVGVATAPTAAGSWSFDSIMERASFWLTDQAVAPQNNESGFLLCDKLPPRKKYYSPSYALVGGVLAYAKNPAITSAATAATVAGGATYLYPLATPKEIDLGSIAMPELPSDRSQVFALTPVPTEVMAVYPETESFSVTRVSPDGSQWLVAEGLTQSQQALDPLPPLNVPYRYVVTAYSMSGEPTSTEVDALVESDAEAYNFGPAAGECILLGFDAAGSESVSHSGETYRFALGPDTPQLPTFYPDGDIDATGNHSYVTYDEELYKRLRQTVRSRSNSLCWFRDCFGNRARVLASWSFSYDAKRYRLFDISADLTEVVFTEPSNG